MRIKAVLAYDGSRFEGFQSQKHTHNTVVSHMQRALSRIGIDTAVIGSGRTDKGVHATQQVIHFEAPSHWQDLQKMRYYLNLSLQPFITIKSLQKVDATFHARFSAKRRSYRYIFSLNKPSVFQSAYVTYIQNIDFSMVAKGLKLFEGEHDFIFFMKTGSDTKSTIRRVTKTGLYTYGSFVVVTIEANGFLRAQVRMIMDALIKLAKKELTIQQLSLQLEAKERFTTTLAPPSGLYLSHVIY